MEVNPKTVDFDKLCKLRKIGINRLSIGIQSFDEKYLKILGRMHTSEEGIETFENARRAGFDNISLDLMFSLPGQNVEEVLKYLKILGRMHTSEEGIETFENARRAGFDNISLDLMFSLPGQNVEEVLKDLNKLLDMKPEHFSIYSLIWEEGTVFFEKLKKGILRETENEIEAEMFEKIIDTAEKRGYLHYEISNFCLEGKEAVHK